MLSLRGGHMVSKLTNLGKYPVAGSTSQRALLSTLGVVMAKSNVVRNSDLSAWKNDKKAHNDWKRRQRLVRRIQEDPVPDKFKAYDEEWDKVTTFESQLASLQKRGFLRAYKAYSPPQDLDERFMKVCHDVLNFEKDGDLRQVKLDRATRTTLLPALEAEFQHIVPNSLLHTMTSVDHVLLFYSTAVDVRTPYEKLHDDKMKGSLPPNLSVQLRSKRFDPDGDSPFDRVTAFPGSSTIMVSPEARKRYKDVIAEKAPFKNSPSDNV